MTNTPDLTSTNPREAFQFRTRKEAGDAAASIGWNRNDATQIEILGFYIWVIADAHGNYLTRDAYNAVLDERRSSTWRQ